MRHFVPIAVALAALSCTACSQSHSMGHEDASTPRDARPPSDDAEPPPPPRDAGPDVRIPPTIDAGPDCRAPSPATPTTVCERRGGGPSLSIRLEGCYCGEELRCHAEVDGPVLRLTTTMCTPELLCDGCMPLEAQCPLPEDYVPGDDYHVTINGRAAFVMRGEYPAEARARCWNPAPPVPDHFAGCSYPERTVRPTDSCIPDEVNTREPIVVSVTSCQSCFADPAGCSFVSTPDGYRFVGAQVRFCDCPTCGRCAPGCSALVQRCTLPPLPEGTHVVEIGDRTEEVVASAGGTGNRLCAPER